MRSVVFGWCLVAMALGVEPSNAGNVLIKAEEAALPPATTRADVALVTRGITRRPSITLTSPGASVTSPFTLEFKFQAHGGSTIEPNSFHLIYLKAPTVDLTDRVKSFVTPNGVDMVGAEAPPGKHLIKVEISDSEHRETSAIFTLNVIK